MAKMAETAQTQESPAAFGSDEAGVAQRWISEIDFAEKDHAAYRKTGQKIVKAYRAEAVDQNSDEVKSRRFSLFWSNIETLGPATLARTPTAVVKRRWADQDQLGRVASEVLERSLNFTVDAIDFFDIAKGVRTDFLLVARGVAWARYVPHMEPVEPAPMGHNGGPVLDPDGDEAANGAEPAQAVGEAGERVAWEEVIFDHVSWDDFLHNPARKWSEIRWVARIVYLTRDELVARFGEEKGKACPLDHGGDENGNSDRGGDEDTQFAKAAVYEIWDKISRKVIWICKAFSSAPLDERDDPLALKDFFPCPRPVIGCTAPDSIIPIPDYERYKGQCRDIDDLTARIGLLTDALKVVGFYAAGGEGKEKLADLFTMKTNTLVPIDSWAAFADKGGVKGLIEWVPIDMVASAYKACIEARAQLINDVYQITGIADIMRGDVDPDETATATRAKGNWGSLRVRDKQKELARFARDLMRIGGEIIATKFSPQTLAEMSNVELFPDAQAKMNAQAMLQQQAQATQHMAQIAQQTGQPPPPPFQPDARMVAMLQKPTWEDVTGLLRNNTLRGFRIDVETDSTIEPNDQEEKQRQIEFTEAVGKLIANMLPLLQMAPQLLEMSTQLLLSLVRKFRAGRELEDVIERAMEQLQQAANAPKPPQQPQGKPGDPPQLVAAKAQALGAHAQAALISAGARQTEAQTGQFEAQTEAHLRAQEIEAENQRTQLDRQTDQSMHGQGLAADMQQAVLKASERHLMREVNDFTPIQAPTR